MDYQTIRSLHIACACISVALFLARGGMQLRGIDWRRWRWLRVLPHVNDTVLLAAAIALAVTSSRYPWTEPWLAAKVLGLCLYVAIGRLALKPGTALPRRRQAFAAAKATVGYIVAVAATRRVAVPRGRARPLARAHRPAHRRPARRGHERVLRLQLQRRLTPCPQPPSARGFKGRARSCAASSPR